MKNLTVTVNGVAYNLSLIHISESSAASDVYKRQSCQRSHAGHHPGHQGQGRRCC